MTQGLRVVASLRPALHSRLALQMSVAGVFATLPQVALADSEIRTSAVVTATGGWSSNPFAETGNARSSAFAQIDVRPVVSVVAENSILAVSAVLDYQHYFRNYGDSNDYGGGVDYSRTFNSRLTAHAAANFDSSIIGGFDSLTPVANPALPLPPVTIGPDLALVGLRDRRTTLSFAGDVGYSLSSYDSITANAYYSRARYGQSETAARYNSYGGGLGYSRRVSAHLQLGAQGSVARYDYLGLIGKSEVYSLQATFKDQFSDRWNAVGAVGVSFSNQSLGGQRTNFTGNLQLCRLSTRASLCLNASDAVLPTGGSGTVNSKAVGGSYLYHLTEHSSFSLDGEYSRNSQPADSRFINGLNVASSYVTGSATYDQQLRRRVHLVASTHYRKVIGNFNGSAADFGGSLGISVRFGDFR